MKSIASENHQALCAELGIKPHERVLEIGGGHNPVCRADVLVDIDFNQGFHRDGQAMADVVPGQSLVKGDLAALPFRDKAFDVVLCLHVLEHVFDPASACRELIRVSGRGFIETPRKWTEYYAGHPTHLWLIEDVDGILFFEPITEDDFPFCNFALPVLWSEPLIREQVSRYRRNIPCVQLYWEGDFSFRVDAPAVVPDTQKMARRHYNFSRNLLRRLVPPGRIIFHARTAMEMEPGNDAYRRLYAFLLIQYGKWRQARKLGATLIMFFQVLLYRCSCLLVRLGDRLARWLTTGR